MAKIIDKAAYCDDGILINSGEFDGITSADARVKITEMLAAKKLQHSKQITNFVTGYFRQRYWGAPIPVVYCEKMRRSSHSRK